MSSAVANFSVTGVLMRIPIVRDRIALLVASDTRRRLAAGAFWNVIAIGSVKVFSVLSSFFVARILGAQTLGEYGMVVGTTGMIGGMAGLGIGQTVTKYVAELKRSDPRRAGRILALSSVVTWVGAIIYGGALAFFSPWLAEHTLSAPQLAPFLRVSAIAVMLGLINCVQSCSLSGCEAYRFSTLIAVVGGVFSSVANVFGAWCYGLWGIVIAGICGTALNVILTRRATVEAWKQWGIGLNWRGVREEWGVLFHYSLPTFLVGLSYGPVVWMANTFLVRRAVDGYAEMGVFNVAQQWQMTLTMIAGTACVAMVPVMSEKSGQGLFWENVKIMCKMIRLILCLTVPVALLIALLCPYIMMGYGARFEGRWPVMLLVLANGVVVTAQVPVCNLVTAEGLMWPSLFSNIGWVSVMLIGSWFFTPRWGAEGLALTYLLAYVLHTGVCVGLIKYIGWRRSMAIEPLKKAV